MGLSEEGRLVAYRNLYSAHLDNTVIDNIRQTTNGIFALGNENFTEQLEQMLKRRAKPGKSGRPGSKVANKQVNQFQNPWSVPDY